MRYASTYGETGAPVVAELQGDLLVPLVGLTELGERSTPADRLRGRACRRHRQARTPPLYLKSGDVVSVEVTGVGMLRNQIA